MTLSILLGVGLVLAWVGERIVENPTARGALTGLGVLLVAVSFVLRLVKSRQGEADARRIHRWLASFSGLSLGALVLYAAQSDLYTRAFGASLESSSPTLAGLLAALWPALLVTALAPTLLMELSFASMVLAPRLEAGRVQEAMFSGLALSFVLTFAFSAQYVASERDSKADLSYFRVARAGEATKKLVASMDEPLEAYLFFPPGSDSAEAVKGYFEELQVASPLLKVTTLDYALEPAKSKELGVTGNGTVVLKKGARKESVFIAVEIEKARTQLRGLDAEIQKRILQVAKSRRTVYLTAGHGERTQDPLGGADQRATIEILYKTLQDQNFDVRTLSAAEGLGQEVPKDAAAVFVLGPTQPFTQPEADALAAYEQRGGRLFLALDPEAGLTFEELLKPLGLSMKAQRIAQERGTANIRPPPSLADRVNIVTRTFSSHPAVTYLGRANAAVLFVGAAPLEELGQHPADLVIDFAVRSIPDAWNDANNNFEFDQASGETKKAHGLVAAVTRRAKSNKAEEELRALVLSDSDNIADELLPLLPGNQYLVVDGFKWLLGDEQLVGATNTEQDVPLTRTRQMDSAWFYGTTFLAPVLVLGLGLVARRRMKKPSKEAKS
ncbi:MAG: Gldg family protein [Myxococcales bacterium]|nr:Gldg family protein [Myxococcales bacterium]